MDDLFYLQDARDHAGNYILWWAKNGAGYTADIAKAHIYSKEEAVSQNHCRETDIPWPKVYIDSKVNLVVDAQNTNISLALKNSGVNLAKPEKTRPTQYRCPECGRF
jgi:hypothetical protein